MAFLLCVPLAAGTLGAVSACTPDDAGDGSGGTVAQSETADAEPVSFTGLDQVTVTGGRIDYIRCNYDTRQSNATYQWILSFNHYVQDTNDTDARQALPARWQKRVAPHTYKKMPCACSAGGGRLFLSEKRLFCPKNLSLIFAVLS